MGRGRMKLTGKVTEGGKHWERGSVARMGDEPSGTGGRRKE